MKTARHQNEARHLSVFYDNTVFGYAAPGQYRVSIRALSQRTFVRSLKPPFKIRNQPSRNCSLA